MFLPLFVFAVILSAAKDTLGITHTDTPLSSAVRVLRSRQKSDD